MEEGEQIDVGCGNYEDSDLFTAVEKYAGLIDRGYQIVRGGRPVAVLSQKHRWSIPRRLPRDQQAARAYHFT